MLSSLRILHTADIHLDAPYRFLGEKGEAQRIQVRKTFESICRLASSEYQLLLISGDLFDCNSVSDASAARVASLFSEMSLPICICPGTHDCMDDRSVYGRSGVNWPANVRVFQRDETSIVFPELDLTIHARANTSNRSSESPLREVSRGGETRWEVGMAHGSIVIPGKVESADFPIRREEIEETGLDYVALGHWHSWGDYTTGAVKAFYSGSPERLAFGGGRGQYASVELKDGVAAVEAREIGRRRMEEVELQITGVQDSEEIKRHIATLADPELALRCALNGVTDLNFKPDVDAIVSEIGAEFFHLQLEDQSHPSSAKIGQNDFPEQLVIGKYVRLMSERIQQAQGDPETVGTLEDALRLGVALLQGRRAI
jgi:DNA repair protein SbcD/Mre11